jgi:putative hydrolase of the HAD superfamily
MSALNPVDTHSSPSSTGGTPVRAVFFDMGGTLEALVADDGLRLYACRRILAALRDAGAELAVSPSVFFTHVSRGLERYAGEREQTQLEKPPARVWRDYILTDGIAGDAHLGPVLEAMAEELAFIWDTEGYHRALRPDAIETLAQIRRLRFKMGIISNVFSVRQVYHDLARFGIGAYFDPVVLSTACGYRKPSAAIFQHAANLAGVPPEACMHVGDSLRYDIAGAKRAGFHSAVLLQAPHTEAFPAEKDDIQPDAIIHSLTDLVAILKS